LFLKPKFAVSGRVDWAQGHTHLFVVALMRSDAAAYEEECDVAQDGR
jgi:hypothetical protein